MVKLNRKRKLDDAPPPAPAPVGPTHRILGEVWLLQKLSPILGDLRDLYAIADCDTKLCDNVDVVLSHLRRIDVGYGFLAPARAEAVGLASGQPRLWHIGGLDVASVLEAAPTGLKSLRIGFRRGVYVSADDLREVLIRNADTLTSLELSSFVTRSAIYLEDDAELPTATDTDILAPNVTRLRLHSNFALDIAFVLSCVDTNRLESLNLEPRSPSKRMTELLDFDVVKRMHFDTLTKLVIPENLLRIVATAAPPKLTSLRVIVHRNDGPINYDLSKLDKLRLLCLDLSWHEKGRGHLPTFNVGGLVLEALELRLARNSSNYFGRVYYWAHHPISLLDWLRLLLGQLGGLPRLWRAIHSNASHLALKRFGNESLLGSLPFNGSLQLVLWFDPEGVTLTPHHPVPAERRRRTFVRHSLGLPPNIRGLALKVCEGVHGSVKVPGLAGLEELSVAAELATAVHIAELGNMGALKDWRVGHTKGKGHTALANLVNKA